MSSDLFLHLSNSAPMFSVLFSSDVLLLSISKELDLQRVRDGGCDVVVARLVNGGRSGGGRMWWWWWQDGVVVARCSG
uniref:Uncharacterized protein n=1 Tax=Helianthus annuus TaxID=4232 RepID=A0A251T130_HELAN